MTALQIAALKRIGRGTKVVLLDRFGNTSKAVAKELARRGFGRVYVVAGQCSVLSAVSCRWPGWKAFPVLSPTVELAAHTE